MKTSKKTFLFYVGHPSQYYVFRSVSAILAGNGHKIIWVTRAKDMLLDLVKETPYKVVVISKRPRQNSKWGLVSSLIKREIWLFFIFLWNRPTLSIGSEIALTHAGKVFGVPSFLLSEDDEHIVPLTSKYGVRFATAVIAPNGVQFPTYEHKRIAYPGFQKLAYLDPSQFTPKPELLKGIVDLNQPYFLLRLSSLAAHHDDGIGGLDDALASRIVARLKDRGQIFISSERALPQELEQYRLTMDPKLMHQVLSHADVLISDSQSMSVEAAMLGTASIRFSDFAGRISVLEELEHKHKLTFGVPTNKPDRLLEVLDDLLAIPDLKVEWKKRQEKMLNGLIDVKYFLAWLIETYPESLDTWRKNPNGISDLKLGVFRPIEEA